MKRVLSTIGLITIIIVLFVTILLKMKSNELERRIQVSHWGQDFTTIVVGDVLEYNWNWQDPFKEKTHIDTIVITGILEDYVEYIYVGCYKRLPDHVQLYPSNTPYSTKRKYMLKNSRRKNTTHK